MCELNAEVGDVNFSGKAAGLDGVATLFLRFGGNACGVWLTKMFNVCLWVRRVSMDYRVYVYRIVPLYRGKGDA